MCKWVAPPLALVESHSCHAHQLIHESLNFSFHVGMVWVQSQGLTEEIHTYITYSNKEVVGPYSLQHHPEF